VEAAHGGVDALGEDDLDRVRRLLDGHIELIPLGATRWSEDVVGSLTAAGRLADPDADPGEARVVDVGLDRLEALVAGRAPAEVVPGVAVLAARIAEPHRQEVGGRAGPGAEQGLALGPASRAGFALAALPALAALGARVLPGGCLARTRGRALTLGHGLGALL